jgi:hypothetical protein
VRLTQKEHPLGMAQRTVEITLPQSRLRS